MEQATARNAQHQLEQRELHQQQIQKEVNKNLAEQKKRLKFEIDAALAKEKKTFDMEHSRQLAQQEQEHERAASEGRRAEAADIRASRAERRSPGGV
jgi:hypothetical protein